MGSVLGLGAPGLRYEVQLAKALAMGVSDARVKEGSGEEKVEGSCAREREKEQRLSVEGGFCLGCNSYYGKQKWKGGRSKGGVPIAGH